MRSMKWLVVGCVALAGCESSTEPVPITLDENELQFVVFPADLAPLVTREASFWAVAGDDRLLVMRYVPEPGETEGEEFLEFKVPGDGLSRRADGSRFEEGDSVLITVRVDPQNRFLFEFEPSGLVFDEDHPAELEITYRRVGGDLDGDGDEDADDRDLEMNLHIWKRERPGDPWRQLGTVQFEAQKELEADITSFTGFCIAA
jgi:hypothetical protein